MGIFQGWGGGVKFSSMIGFVVIPGKKKCGRVKSKAHPSYTHRAIGFSFEVEAMVLGFHQHKAILDAQVGEQLHCQRETGNPHDTYAVANLKSGVVVQPCVLSNGRG